MSHTSSHCPQYCTCEIIYDSDESSGLTEPGTTEEYVPSDDEMEDLQDFDTDEEENSTIDPPSEEF